MNCFHTCILYNKEALTSSFWTGTLILICDIVDITSINLNIDELKQPIVHNIHQIYTVMNSDGTIEVFINVPEFNLSATIASTFAKIITYSKATKHLIEKHIYMIF